MVTSQSRHTVITSILPYNLTRQVDIIFTSLWVKKLRWLVKVTLWVSGSSRAGLEHRSSGSGPVFLRPHAKSTLWRWKAVTRGMEAGAHNRKDTMVSAPPGAAATANLTCWRPRHQWLLAEQAWSLFPQILLQFFSRGRRSYSLECLMLQPQIPARGKSPKPHKCNLIVYFLTRTLPVCLVKPVIQQIEHLFSSKYGTYLVP